MKDEKVKGAEVVLRQRILGSFLKKSRESAGLTQVEIARALSYSTAQFVSNWERGLSLPPLNVLRKLVKVLGVPPRQMIDTLHRYQDEMLKLQKRQILRIFTRAS